MVLGLKYFMFYDPGVGVSRSVKSPAESVSVPRGSRSRE